MNEWKCEYTVSANVPSALTCSEGGRNAIWFTNVFEHLPKRSKEKSNKMAPAFGEFIIPWERNSQIRLRSNNHQLSAYCMLGTFMLIVWFTLLHKRLESLFSWVTWGEMGVAACASFCFPYTIELHDPWQPRSFIEYYVPKLILFHSIASC